MLSLALECENRKHLLHANQEEQPPAADTASAESVCLCGFFVCRNWGAFIARST